ncbi:nucleoside diphosphate kinase-like [Ornithodoros turicata]|uniref:nucleoside diphosphate kinase-like n=1 Tax=Ornithodoros turicata TaxID=34597 RepID=UPI0031399ED0
MAHRERSFIMVKPDGVQRGLVGEIIRRFEKRGYKLVALKLMQAGEELMKEHYADIAERPFFDSHVQYMQMGPVVLMVWEGANVVATGRHMIGRGDPFKSNPGTIRGDHCVNIGRTVIHGSSSAASAEKEIALWFTEQELVSWTPTQTTWVYED